jgi:hypothetical protein
MPQSNQLVYGLSLILAPLVMFISSFFWVNGEYGVTGGTILILSTVFWIMAMIHLFGLLKIRMPGVAPWGLLIAIFGFVSGALFGFVGVLTEIFGISHQTYLDAFAKYPVSTGLLLFWPGPLAPLSFILLGVFFLRTKTTRSWVAVMLIVGGLAFPASRISRNESLAHVADIDLLIPLSYLGMQILFAQRR